MERWLAERWNCRINFEVDDALKKKTWELFLNEDDKLRWRGYQDGREVIYVNEPESTWFQRFVAGIIQLLPVKSQL